MKIKKKKKDLFIVGIILFIMSIFTFHMFILAISVILILMSLDLKHKGGKK